MKKILILLAFILVSQLIWAQTDMMGISYDMNLAEARKHLESAKWVLLEDGAEAVSYQGTYIDLPAKIQLYKSSTNKLQSWLYSLDFSGDFDDYEEILSSVANHHNSVSFYEGFTDTDIILLEGDRAIYFYASSGTLYIEYVDDDLDY